MADDIYEELLAAQTSGDATATLEKLATYLREAHQYHDLFDVRLMQARHKQGLPIIWTKTLDQIPEPQRTAVEDASLEACREVGNAMLEVGRVREAWMYLRPAGNRAETAAALERLVREDESLAEDVIEIALNEGVAPRLGFELVLRNHGLCNAVTTFDSQLQGRPKEERREIAELLVRHIHEELLHGVRSDVARQQGTEPTETTLAELVRDREWLFDNDNYHVDATHLQSIVRFAVIVDDPEVLRLAIDLTEYGRRLGSAYQYPGRPPFEDTYVDHARYFKALLGEGVEETVAHFKQLAEAAADGQDSNPVEVYLSLLARTGRRSEAIEETARLLPPGRRMTDLAPSLQELAVMSGDYDRLMQVSRSRSDLLGFAAGLLSKKA
jgi:hypothetical protein